MADKLDSTVVTPVATIAYAFVWDPRENDRGQQEYSCSLLFDEGTDISDIKQAIANAAINKFGDDAVEKLKNGELRSPIRNQSEKASQAGFGTEGVFFGCRSTSQPGIVDMNVKPILDHNKLFSGCKVRADVRFFGYEQSGNKGVGCGLNNIQLVETGERIDGRRSAEQAFAPVGKAAGGDVNPSDLF